MFAHLAQFDLPGGYAGPLSVLVAALLMLGTLLAGIRSLRTNLADELKRELQAQTQAQRIDVQQPLEVKTATIVVTRDDLAQVHGRIGRERAEINDTIAQVRADAERRSDKLEAKLDANTKLTAEMSGELKQMNQNIHTLTTSVTQFLQSQSRS